MPAIDPGVSDITNPLACSTIAAGISAISPQTMKAASISIGSTPPGRHDRPTVYMAQKSTAVSIHRSPRLSDRLKHGGLSAADDHQHPAQRYEHTERPIDQGEPLPKKPMKSRPCRSG